MTYYDIIEPSKFCVAPTLMAVTLGMCGAHARRPARAGPRCGRTRRGAGRVRARFAGTYRRSLIFYLIEICLSHTHTHK